MTSTPITLENVSVIDYLASGVTWKDFDKEMYELFPNAGKNAQLGETADPKYEHIGAVRAEEWSGNEYIVLFNEEGEERKFIIEEA